MAGEYSERLLTRANRVAARMAKRLDYTKDVFAVHEIFGPDGSINFDVFFKQADECGHQYGAERCDCSLCEQLRPQLTRLMQQAMMPPQGT